MMGAIDVGDESPTRGETVDNRGMKDTPAKYVRSMPDGRFLLEIDKIVALADGTKRRERIRRRMPAGTTAAEAQAIAAKLVRDLTIKAAAVAVTGGWIQYVEGLSAGKGSWLYVCAANMRHRAKERGVPCTLNVDQLRQVLLRSGGRCEVTGLRFTHEKEEGQRVRPFFHSFDRIDSRAGYTIDNVRAVCHAANIAMNTWGEDVFAELARGYVFNRYSALYALAT